MRVSDTDSITLQELVLQPVQISPRQQLVVTVHGPGECTIIRGFTEDVDFDEDGTPHRFSVPCSELKRHGFAWEDVPLTFCFKTLGQEDIVYHIPQPPCSAQDEARCEALFSVLPKDIDEMIDNSLRHAIENDPCV